MPANRIWTVGHSTRSADAFVDLLRTHQIDRLADIRTIPQSRRHPHFGREALDRLLRASTAFSTGIFVSSAAFASRRRIRRMAAGKIRRFAGMPTTC